MMVTKVDDFYADVFDVCIYMPSLRTCQQYCCCPSDAANKVTAHLHYHAPTNTDSSQTVLHFIGVVQIGVVVAVAG